MSKLTSMSTSIFDSINKMRFEKVSYKQWEKDYMERIAKYSIAFEPNNINSQYEACAAAYEQITLPTRATPGSAGYDFYLPYNVTVPYRFTADNDTLLLPTGIRWVVENNNPVVLKLYIRSSMGIKKNMVLANGTGIIDADYCKAVNEGHIMIAVKMPKYPFVIDEPNIRIAQGIISNYLVVDNDIVVETADDSRKGGFGSTGK